MASRLRLPTPNATIRKSSRFPGHPLCDLWADTDSLIRGPLHRRLRLLWPHATVRRTPVVSSGKDHAAFKLSSGVISTFLVIPPGVCCSSDRVMRSADNARRAAELGILISISTDSHSTGEVNLIGCGIDQARRAGLEKSGALNCLPWPKLQRLFRR